MEEDVFAGLSGEELARAKEEAARMAAIALRAEQRALARKQQQAEEFRIVPNGEAKLTQEKKEQERADGTRFLTKAEREELRRRREQSQSLHETTTAKVKKDKQEKKKKKSKKHARKRNEERDEGEGEEEELDEQALAALKSRYLPSDRGTKSLPAESTRRPRKTFKFAWEASEDTTLSSDPLYSLSSPSVSEPTSKRYRDELELGVDSKRSKPYSNNKQHWSTKPVSQMNARDWHIMREDFDIIVRGPRMVPPMYKWDQDGLTIPPSVRAAISDARYMRPTPIQMQAIPLGLKLRDVIGVAETGSGKTVAFLVPLLAFIDKQPKARLENCSEDGPLAVVMGPTRELVQQIGEEAKKLSSKMPQNVRTAVVIGGSSLQEQIGEMRNGTGAQIVVATPGRLLECLENRYVVFTQCCYLVLDEADKMIDMGFEPQVEAVLKNMQSTQKADKEEDVVAQEEAASRGEGLVRVTVMFSATMPPAVERLAQKYMRFPAIVRIGDTKTGKNKRITQKVYMVPNEKKKQEMLLKLVRETPPPIIVFANSKRGCDMVGKFLMENSLRCCVLHGGKMQSVREANLEGFKSGKYDILLATDVAGRGLDISDVAHVINYEMATDIDRYTHRIGRTGRAGKSGLASTLLSEADADVFLDLVQYLKSTNASIPTALASHPKAKPEGEIQA